MTFLSQVKKPGLNYDQHQELARLCHIWEGNDNSPQWLIIESLGRRQFGVYLEHINPETPGTFILIGSYKEVRAYLRGLIHGKRNMVNI